MSRTGATLLEALVALAVAAIVLAGLYSAVARAATARREATAHADRLAAARTVLLGLAGELSAAIRPTLDDPPTGRFTLEAPAAGSPPWSALRFASGARAPAVFPASDVRVVSYRVTTDAEGTGILVRSAADAEPVPVLAGVRALRVRVFDGLAWQVAWPAGELPRAVDLRLAVDDGRGGTTELGTEVALPAAAH